MAEFQIRFAQLTKKAKHLFMEGKLTLGQAHQFSTMRHRFRKMQLEDLTRRHASHHEELLVAFPHLNYRLDSIEELMRELSQHSRAVLRAITCGQLTLLQARYARERSFGRKHLAEFMALNAMDRITTPLARPAHKAPRDRIPLRRPASHTTRR